MPLWLQVTLLVPAIYFGIGIIIGACIVRTHRARFFSAGWRWKRMAKHVALVALAWPVALVEIVFG